MTAILHLLPKESYQKYVRFFTGLLLMLLVAAPILSLFGKEDVLMEKISQAEFLQEMDNMKMDTAYMEDIQKETYKKEYEKAIGMDISRMAENAALQMNQVEVSLSEEYQVEQISMEVCFSEDKGLHISKASFSDNSREYPQVYELKQELMEYYGLEESQITISVQEGGV